jgi:iron complex transport system substrate-binding protein
VSPLLIGDQIRSMHRTPSRLVSLVPSLTQSLYDLGLADPLVGVTDFCQPAEQSEAHLTRVGGTKNPDLQAIVDLQPELVLANREENERSALESLSAAGLSVWISFPRSVPDAMRVLWNLAGMFHSQEAAQRLQALERAVEWTTSAAARQAGRRYFCPMWQGDSAADPFWLMTFNRETYCHDLLARCGGENIFANRNRRYPREADLGRAEAEPAGDRDTRYPRVTLEEVRRGSPHVILLPSEPFAFGEGDSARLKDLLAGTPAVEEARVYLVDGRGITWHGTWIGRALAEFPSFFQDDIQY